MFPLFTINFSVIDSTLIMNLAFEFNENRYLSLERFLIYNLIYNALLIFVYLGHVVKLKVIVEIDIKITSNTLRVLGNFNFSVTTLSGLLIFFFTKYIFQFIHWIHLI